MILPEIPVDEIKRIRSLQEYSLLDTLPERDFDDITRLASEICGTPIALITLIDTNRQWFKSNHGLPMVKETPRDVSFCAHTINKPQELMIIPDARTDERFFDNPLVADPAGVVFYTGVPLTNIDGYTMGTLCILDYKPRDLDKSQNNSLKSLGNIVVKLFELRRKNILLEESKQSLKKINQELEQFAYVVSHDIKSPVNNIIAFSEMLKTNYALALDDDGKEIVDYLNKSALKLKSFIEGILSYYKGDKLQVMQKETIELNQFLVMLLALLDPRKEFSIDIPPPGITVEINRTAFEQIFINLISNAMKYNDKAKGIIIVQFSEANNYYTFSIKDNGTGIDEKDHEKIFSAFETLGKKDRYENYGTGIGLSTVKKLVEKIGGKLTLDSSPGIGSTFTFTILK